MNTPNEGASASAQAGSAAATVNGPGSGQPADLSQYVPKTEYDELFKKLGEQGKEFGDLRTWAKGVEPLLLVLENNPETVKAIMAGKVNDDLATAVLSGKMDFKQAEAVVAEAVEEVKNDMGETQFNATNPEDIAKIVERVVGDKLDKGIGEKLKAFESKIEEVTETVSNSNLESEIRDFIANTSDIGEYLDQIQEYLDTHPDLKNTIGSVEAAYHFVKSKAFDEARKAQEDVQRAEAEKLAALNAGSGSAGSFRTGSDSLIGGGTVNPNNWSGD